MSLSNFWMSDKRQCHLLCYLARLVSDSTHHNTTIRRNCLLGKELKQLTGCSR